MGCLFLSPGLLSAQQMPQDYWEYQGEKTTNSQIAMDGSRNLYHIKDGEIIDFYNKNKIIDSKISADLCIISSFGNDYIKSKNLLLSIREFSIFINGNLFFNGGVCYARGYSLGQNNENNSINYTAFGTASFFTNSSDFVTSQGKFNYYNFSIINPVGAVIRRSYYGFMLPPSLPLIPPDPQVINVYQRRGTTYVDLDYIVNSSTNSPLLSVGLLGFVNGQQDLNHLIIPTTFVDNTQTNIGTNIAPNTTNHLTWNAAADWSTNIGSINFEILANDGRPLQPQSWTYSPTNLPAKLTGTVIDPWSMWLWLLAIHDPSLSLQNGTIVGVVGSYKGQILVNNGTSTTSAGQQFLQDLVNAQVPLVLSNSVAR
jgi:hypothetical protein